MLKAITTIYNGNRFRSRLEARWAVFFDCMGWVYEYEENGYQLPSKWYLPDFYFRQWNCYAEVKPVQLSYDEIKLVKELSLGMETDGSIDVLLLEGIPKPISYRTIISGDIGTNVIFTSSQEKITPFFSSDEFISEWTMLDKTKIAIKIAKQYRFEHGEGLK